MMTLQQMIIPTEKKNPTWPSWHTWSSCCFHLKERINPATETTPCYYIALCTFVFHLGKCCTSFGAILVALVASCYCYRETHKSRFNIYVLIECYELHFYDFSCDAMLNLLQPAALAQGNLALGTLACLLSKINDRSEDDGHAQLLVACRCQRHSSWPWQHQSLDHYSRLLRLRGSVKEGHDEYK
jgi:hypothetical protein